MLTNAAEFEELPVRHNEDKINMELAEQLPLETDLRSLDSPHTKVSRTSQFVRLSLTRRQAVSLSSSMALVVS